MEQNINKAVKLYSGDRPVALFVEKLNKNIESLNNIYLEIKEIFSNANINNLEKLPTIREEKAKFASEFKNFVYLLEAARIQGFNWDNDEYIFNGKSIKVLFDEHIYNTLLKRYEELFSRECQIEDDNEKIDSTFDLEGYLTSIDTEKIDADYMNTRFEKYLRKLNQENVSQEDLDKTLDELHKSFVSLSQTEQKYANIFIHDIQSGQIIIDSNKKFKDYIMEYQHSAENNQINKISNELGLDEEKLRKIMSLKVNENNIDEFGRFNELINTIKIEKAKTFLERKLGKELTIFDVNIKSSTLLRNFILQDGFDIDEYKIK